jgi:hypothetical protein
LASAGTCSSRTASTIAAIHLCRPTTCGTAARIRSGSDGSVKVKLTEWLHEVAVDRWLLETPRAWHLVLPPQVAKLYEHPATVWSEHSGAYVVDWCRSHFKPSPEPGIAPRPYPTFPQCKGPSHTRHWTRGPTSTNRSQRSSPDTPRVRLVRCHSVTLKRSGQERPTANAFSSCDSTCSTSSYRCDWLERT